LGAAILPGGIDEMSLSALLLGPLVSLAGRASTPSLLFMGEAITDDWLQLWFEKVSTVGTSASSTLSLLVVTLNQLLGGDSPLSSFLFKDSSP
jgi:hypothetical protein